MYMLKVAGRWIHTFRSYAHIKVRNGRELVWSYIGLVSPILRRNDDSTGGDSRRPACWSVTRSLGRSVGRFSCDTFVGIAPRIDRFMHEPGTRRGGPPVVASRIVRLSRRRFRNVEEPGTLDSPGRLAPLGAARPIKIPCIGGSSN